MEKQASENRNDYSFDAISEKIEKQEEVTLDEQIFYWKTMYEKSEHERECEARLFPCPFCGERVRVTALTPHYEGDDWDAYLIECQNEECQMKHLVDSGNFEVGEAFWNRRPDDRDA